MHKNTCASVLIVWELKEFTEYCQLLKKGSESALEVRRCTTKLCHLEHMRRRRITCFNASLHPSEQFYMHKNTSASVLIVWELKGLTEYCQLLKRGPESALEVRRCTTKFSHLAHMRRRRSPVQCKFTSQWTVLYAYEEFRKCTHRVRAKRVNRVLSASKKGSESALEVRRCTTKFSHLAHMRRRRSPVPMQVYIPVNSSICIRTLPQVYSSCES